MSDTSTDTITAALAGLRCRERELELEAVAVRSRIEEIRDMIERLEPRRRPGRPRKDKADADLMQLCPDGIIRPVEAGTSALNPYPSPIMQQGTARSNIVPQRVEGGAHETETTETAA